MAMGMVGKGSAATKLAHGRTAQACAETILEAHGRMGSMAIAIAILKDIIPDHVEVETLEEEWQARFT